jgi:hypothetical protein
MSTAARETPTVLEQAGAAATGHFTAYNSHADGFGRLTFVTSDSWITVDAILTQPPGSVDVYEVTVATSTELSQPGLYEGWVEAHAASCYECVRVLLTVTAPAPPAVKTETWGKLKSSYR